METDRLSRLAGQVMSYLILLAVAAMIFGMLGFYGWAVGGWTAMRFWPEVPAQVRRVELKQAVCCEADVRVVRADYIYEWRGEAHTGSRVFALGECGHPASMRRAAHAEIASRSGDRGPFRCYVNPLNPRQAVLYRYASVSMVFLSTFLALFLGVVFAAVVSLFVETGKDRRCQRRHPDEPWRWRAEWETGVVPSCREGSVSGAVLQAFVFNLLCLSVLPIAVLDTWDGNGAAAKLLLFPVVGAGVALWAARRARRWQKGWATVFEMDTLPAEIGGTLVGRVRVREKYPTTNGAVLSLECEQYPAASEGSIPPGMKVSLWRESFLVPQGELTQEEDVMVIPVRLPVPPGLPPSGEDASGNRIEWALHVAPGLPALGWWARFALPVFSVPEGHRSEEAGTPSTNRVPIDPHEMLRRADIKERVLPQGGLELEFPRVPIPAAVLSGLVLCLIAFFITMLNLGYDLTPDQNLIAVAVSSLPFALILGLRLWSGTWDGPRVTVTKEGVRVPGETLRLGIRRKVGLDRIASVETSESIDFGGRTHGVVLRVKEGVWILAAHRLPYPAALAVQCLLEVAIRNCGGETGA